MSNRNLLNWTGRLVTKLSCLSVDYPFDRDDPAHLVDQAIHDMEGIGDASNQGSNGTDQLFGAALPVDGDAAL